MIFNQPPKEVAGECVMSPAECKERYLGNAFTLVLLEGLRLACDGS